MYKCLIVYTKFTHNYCLYVSCKLVYKLSSLSYIGIVHGNVIHKGGNIISNASARTGGISVCYHLPSLCVIPVAHP